MSAAALSQDSTHPPLPLVPVDSIHPVFLVISHDTTVHTHPNDSTVHSLPYNSNDTILPSRINDSIPAIAKDSTRQASRSYLGDSTHSFKRDSTHRAARSIA